MGLGPVDSLWQPGNAKGGEIPLVKIWRAIRIVFLCGFALLVLLACTGLALRGHRQHVIARAIAIRTPNGIDERMYVQIGGINQWVQIRGQDRNNPVILCLHGGPGGSWVAQTTVFLPW